MSIVISAILAGITSILIPFVAYLTRGKKWRREILTINVICAITAISITVVASYRLDAKVTAIQEYSSIAQLDSAGYQIGYHANGGFIEYSSPITRMMEGLYTVNEDGSYSFLVNQMNEAEYLAVMKGHPKFPFPYFLYALYLYDKDDEGWKDYARDAKKILKYTTSIDGHHRDHDKFLEWTLLLLRDIDPRSTPVDN